MIYSIISDPISDQQAVCMYLPAVLAVEVSVVGAYNVRRFDS